MIKFPSLFFKTKETMLAPVIEQRYLSVTKVATRNGIPDPEF